jgi:gamma-butyrobetaine dioxygenase
VTLWPDGAGRAARRDCAWLSLRELAAAGPATGDARTAAWFRRLCAEGLAFLDGVPAAPGAILEAAGAIGLIQQTNYGTLFDVRATPRAENLAYTDLGLGLHTDNPYRDPVPGFQVLHCLVAAPDGGDNLFADGFAIAAALRATDPDTFELLASTPVDFEYRSRDALLQSAQPLIRLDSRGDCIAVHYNSRSIAPLPAGAPGLAAFYAAYRRFAQLLREPQFQMTVRLAPGELVVFDNWRILHARTSFRAARHLQGCYLTRDSVFSRSALLRDTVPGEDAR